MVGTYGMKSSIYKNVKYYNNIKQFSCFYGKHSKMSLSQKQLWELLWPELGIVINSLDYQSIHLDMELWFDRLLPLILEIGSGTGTSTMSMANMETSLNVIAIEIYKKGISQLIHNIIQTFQTFKPITNIRMVLGDAVNFLVYMLDSNNLTGVRVFFPDPWTKLRHHKRRLINLYTTSLIIDRLITKGVLHIATDYATYVKDFVKIGSTEPTLSYIETKRTKNNNLILINTVRKLSISIRRQKITKYEHKANSKLDIIDLIWTKQFK